MRPPIGSCTARRICCPSLVVDRYGDYLVLQALSQGMDRLLPEITRLLERVGSRPRGILARNDPRVRLLEGLDQRVEVLHGDGARRHRGVAKGSISYQVDLRQRSEDRAVPRPARESRRRGRATRAAARSTAFSYNGGFALALARALRRSRSPSTSRRTRSPRIRANAARNGLANVDARAVNVFDELRELERRGERFDTIVLDPPAFAKNKAAVPKALSGYKEINLRALKLLEAGRATW